MSHTIQHKQCSVIGCDRSAHWTARGVRGFCSSHWRKVKLYGSPDGGRSTDQGAPRDFLNRVVKMPPQEECIIWPFARNSAGYGHLNINGKFYLAHRVICADVNGNPEAPDLLALHNCGNGHLGCCNPSHLRWGTHKENTEDSRSHRTLACGSKSGHAKLTDNDVIEIRRLKGKILQRDLADRFAVTQSNISYIQRMASWRSF